MILDGNLILEGSISNSVVVVTGDVYARDCTVIDCVLLIQGKFICNGYIKNSSVVVGEDQSLRVSDGYVMKSVVSAGKICVEGYCSESLIAGKLEKTGHDRPDIRNSSVFDNDVIYEKMIKIAESLDE